MRLCTWQKAWQSHPSGLAWALTSRSDNESLPVKSIAESHLSLFSSSLMIFQETHSSSELGAQLDELDATDDG